MAYQNKGQQQTGFWATVKEVAVLLLIVFLIRTFGFGLYQVPTGSMETTMLVGERFFADKFSYLFTKPQRNEIIALNDPTYTYSSNPLVRLYQEYVGWPIWPFGPVNFTKRIIGIPGDHVEGKIEDGKPVVYLNGTKLDEPYLNKYPLIQVLDRDRSDIYNARLDWRSYDPTKPFGPEQPFYGAFIRQQRMIYAKELPADLLHYLAAANATITPEGTILLEPGKPITAGEAGSINPVGQAVQAGGRQGKSTWTDSDIFDVYLGDNQYWLMGDNRRGSKDSRYFGPVDGRLIHGKILYRIWSIDSDESWWIIDLIKHPIDFWQRMRWNRFFQRVC
jgi:signal peptidase I